MYLVDCDLDLDPMTFIYELDPYSLEIHRMACANMNFLREVFRKLSSDRHTDRLTESTEIIKPAASRVTKYSLSFSSVVVVVVVVAKCWLLWPSVRELVARGRSS